ncbi:cupin domain-containing protein [Blastopirellula marina]|uniref:Cupin domain-containing protein n=1 Tax=Blastopirellula marina TaxID=124 RepID=A0A2S8F6S3_9BACT|nr:cupin domain-containing protein [Blastopirellula marina]PQO27859.1 cupin domain-containing protein [Blastopirellula marina]PTL41594.1 cupin domain-containing protein [Blastopirellula marina]
MRYLLLLMLVGVSAAVGYAAGNSEHQGERVKLIGGQDIQEKLDGSEAHVSVVEVTIAPGENGMPHRHPGPVFGYVLEGDYELGVDDQPTQVFHTGETFYEPTGCLHRVSKNPSTDKPTRLIAVVVHPRDAKELAVPDAKKH